ncbi:MULTISPECIES: response regulator transcription factor [Rhizobium]|uniref:Nodulation protein W n=1 Tax=Rhizobium favelukesii TaxID=348824 RepID=W6RP84_9HYPH|nr:MULTISPECIES: response regulator [Rhizobium]MCS0459259.1 response regulator [Rhizobium favelukesii]UFS79078.1 response regulator [Rhizobium sp. T136]CDM62574.1 Nodulation protein W [Rhizobium favelukesii]
MSNTTEGPLIYIIDDDEELRLSLDSVFRSVGLKTRSFGSAKDFLEAKRPDVLSCLVVDVRLPGISGLDFQDQLAKSGAFVPIVLMTGHGDIPMTVRAMKAGAVDFLAKPFRDQDMLDAVSAALQLDRERRAGDSELAALRNRYAELSLREKQVMALVTTGLMNKQVAGKLSLSEVTVKIHRGSAMRKMEARTLADLVKMAELLKLHDTLIQS